jgi:hypothetical protein
LCVAARHLLPLFGRNRRFFELRQSGRKSAKHARLDFSQTFHSTTGESAAGTFRRRAKDQCTDNSRAALFAVIALRKSASDMTADISENYRRNAAKKTLTLL